MEVMEKPRSFFVLAAEERLAWDSPVHLACYQLNYISRF
jgi:hypothetical protein